MSGNLGQYLKGRDERDAWAKQKFPGCGSEQSLGVGANPFRSEGIIGETDAAERTSPDAVPPTSSEQADVVAPTSSEQEDSTSGGDAPRTSHSRQPLQFAVTPSDPDVVESSKRFQNDLDLPHVVAVRLAMLKKSGQDPDLYEQLLIAIGSLKVATPSIKITRNCKTRNIDVLVAGSEVLLQATHSESSIPLEIVLKVEKSANSAEFSKFFNKNPAALRAKGDFCVVITLPSRTYSLIFTSSGAANRFVMLVNLHIGVGHPLFDLTRPKTDRVFSIS